MSENLPPAAAPMDPHAEAMLPSPVQSTPVMSPTTFIVGGSRWVANIVWHITQFGQGPTGQFGAADVPIATTALSWPLAKALALILTDAVKNYEVTEGEINLPKSFLDQFATGAGVEKNG